MSKTKNAGPRMLKRKKKMTVANDEKQRKKRPKKVNNKDAMEDEEFSVDKVDKQNPLVNVTPKTTTEPFLQDLDVSLREIDEWFCLTLDKQIEAKMMEIEVPGRLIILPLPLQDQFTEESDPAVFMSNWPNFPDLVFDTIMMMVNVTALRKCSQVCTSWKEKITKNILENKTKKNIIRARMERALGPGMFPSAEEICNAKWLGK